MKNRKKIPSRVELGDVASFISGGTPSKGSPHYWGGDIPWVTAKDMKSFKLSGSLLTLTKEGGNNARVVPAGSILVLVRGMTLFKDIPVVLIEREMAFNQDIKALLVKDEYCAVYIAYQLVAKKRHIMSLVDSAGHGTGRLDVDLLKSVVVDVPHKAEQQKIASFLSSVDEKLTKLRRKRELLDTYKRGVMQKIFSQELRFKKKGGDDFPEWEEKRACEVFSNHSNKNHNGDLPILAATQDGGMVYRDEIGKDIKTSEASVNSYKVVEVGDFVISLRSFQGGIEYSRVHGICSPAYTILKSSLEIDDDFYRHYFKRESFISQLSATVIGIRDGKQISYDAFSGMKLWYPSVPEQKKISEFINAIDEKILIQNKQVEQIETFKKALLQKMFI